MLSQLARVTELEELITGATTLKDVPLAALRRQLPQAQLVLEKLRTAIEHDSAERGRGPGIEDVARLLQHQAAIGTG